jgi:octaprenyl-diphosphate synthase
MTSQKIAAAAGDIATDLPQEDKADTISNAMQAVEQLMFDVVKSDITVLQEASWHILEAGGKRIRPRLMLLCYAATGGQHIEQVIAPAAAIELVHTASVVHDDINDHGVVRRGRPSVNSIWGRTFALLTGDFLFTKVYELMAPYKDLNIMLAEATVALVEGETLQASAVKENNLSTEIYFNIIARKTAALFRAGAEMGARLTNADQRQIDALGRFGYNIGLAFQIVDDILDLVGDEEQLGKTARLDQAQGKGIGSIHEENDRTASPMDNIKQKLLEGDRIDQAQEHARNLILTAISLLDVLPQSPYRDGLAELAQSVINRQH